MCYISVIVPAYNEEKYLKKTLKSIRNQEYTDYEIIVVDNGSEDQTIEVAKGFADKVLYCKEKGAAKARNFGAKKAKGDILVFWDADTTTEDPKLLDKVAQAINKGVSGGRTRLKMDGNSWVELLYNHPCEFIDRILFYKFGKANYFSYTPFLFCAKEAFEKVGGFPTGLQATEEIRLLKKLQKENKLYFIKDSIVISSSRKAKGLGTFYGGVWLPFYHYHFPKSEKFPYKSVR